MTAEPGKKVEELFHAALEREPGERDAFLQKACAGDEALLAEVKSLLDADERAERFIEQPAADAATQAVSPGAGQSRFSAGATLGPYEILALIGAGGMGEVYRARDPRLGRDVAVKLITTDDALSPDRLRRFETEARAAASLAHPNVVTVHDIGTHDGHPYLVLELLEGETLRETLRGGVPPLRQAVVWALEVSRGLAAAHERGIVHRDLKPENVFLTKDGRLKVLDFGLAKLREPLASSDMDRESPTETKGTSPGMMLGTVGYMSPEQVKGETPDPRTDVFTLGAVLYEVVTGRRAFGGSTTPEAIASILRDEPPSLESLQPGVPASLEAVVRRCLAKRPADRFSSGGAVEAALETVLASLEPSRATGVRAAEPRGPYPGLSSFTEADAERFFGREAEVEALWGKLHRGRLLALIGPSGAGKTSFVRAGLGPARPSGWGMIVSTPGASPLMSLAEALAPEMAGDTGAVQQLLRFENTDVALSVLRKWRERHLEGLLVMDQFEELFTLNPPEVQERVAALLGRLVAEADVHVLLSLRDDFLMRCDGHDALRPVFGELTPLSPLTHDGLQRALTEPAKTEGFAFEDESLIAEMLEAVEGARGALPLLAFAVARLWERRDREKKLLTRKAYEEVGGVAGALAQHAEQTMERIGLGREPVVRELFRNLVTAQWTRAVADREQLLSVCPDREVAAQVLDALIDARLLTSYETTAGRGIEDAEGTEEAGDTAPHRIEIVHESLLKAWPRLVRWQVQDEEGAVLRDQLKQAAHLWEEKGRAEDLLWTGTAYQEYELWRQRYAGALTAAEDQFTSAMVEHVGRARKRRRLAIAVVFVVLLAGLGTVSTLWRQSDVSRQRAEASSLVALGRPEIDRYPTAALAYARKSLEVAETPAGRRLAVEALWRGPTARILPLGGSTSWSADFSPDGHWLATYTFSAEVLLFPDDGGSPNAIGEHEPHAGGGRAFFTPDGSALLTWRRGPSPARMFSVPDGRELGWYGPGLEPPGWGPDDPWDMWGDNPEGEIYGVRGGGGENAPIQFELWPWDGGSPRIVGSLVAGDRRTRGTNLLAGSELALVRGQRVVVRPVAGPPTTPEREVATLGDGRLRGLWFGPRGRSLAVVQPPDRLTLWPLGLGAAPSPRVLNRPQAERGPTFSPRGTRLAWGSSAQSAVSLWDLEGPPDAGPLVLRRPDAKFTKKGVFHPDGEWLLVSNDDSFTFWAVGQPRVRVLRGHTQQMRQVVFTSDSKWLVSCALDGVRLWPLEAKIGHSRSLATEPKSKCYGLAVDPSARQILYGGTGGAFLMPFAGGGGQWLHRNRGDHNIRPGAFDASGRLAASGSVYTKAQPSDQTAYVWDLTSGASRSMSLVPPGEAGAKGYEWGLSALQFTPEGRLLAAGSGGVRRLDVEAEESDWIWRLDKQTGAFMALGDDGRHLLAATQSPLTTGPPDGRPPMLFDLEQDTRRPITRHGNQVTAVALDPSGRAIVTGDANGAVRVGPLDDGEPHLLAGHTGPVVSVAVSPDGRWIASAAGSEIRLWPMPDVTTTPLHRLPLDDLLARLHDLTNLQVVEDDAAPTGYKVETGPFPGWKDAPTWYTPAPEWSARPEPPQDAP